MQIYPVSDCLLRQLGQDLGHPVEVGVEGLSFAHHVLEGDTLYPRPPERDHHAGLPVGQGLHRGRAEPAREDSVRGRGDAAALDVADDREARVVGAFGPVYVVVQFFGGNGRALRDHNHEVGLALLEGLLDEEEEVLRTRLELGDDGGFGPARDGAHERQVARVTAHYLHDVGPLVRARGVFDPVYGLQRRVERRIHPNGRVRAPHVVVYGRGNSYHLDPELREPQSPRQTTVPAYDHEPLDPGLGELARRLPLSLRCGELGRPFGAEHGATAVDDAAETASVHGVDSALQQPLVAGPDPHHVPAPEKRRPRHRPYRGVHPRRVTSAGQNSYPHRSSHLTRDPGRSIRIPGWPPPASRAFHKQFDIWPELP